MFIELISESNNTYEFSIQFDTYTETILEKHNKLFECL